MEVCFDDQPQQVVQEQWQQLQISQKNTQTSDDFATKPEINAKYTLFNNIHLHLPPPTTPHTKSGKTVLTRDNFTYFHYNCDGFQDTGWGCAYRTLQSVCSWIRSKAQSSEDGKKMVTENIPTIPEIQQTLVNVGDKTIDFVGSRNWIGALEVFYVIDSLYEVTCKILHIPKREDLKKYANVLKRYFEDFGGLVMMGGDMDASSKGIAGIHISGNQAYFLIVDPHFNGKPKSIQELIDRGYVRWQHTSEFVDSSFYNLCLPLLA